jgi:flagellum-specific ATP synthase
MHEAATLPESLRQMQAALQEEKDKPGAAQRTTRPHHNPYEGNAG